MYFTMPKRHFDLELLSNTFEDPTADFIDFSHTERL
jgi:hypothetical protein